MVDNKEKNTEATAEETVEEKAEEKVIERPYTLRRLVDGDLWPVLKIIGEVFPDELSTQFTKLATKEAKITEVGVTVVTKLVLAVLKNIHKVHDDVYALLADVSGIPAAKIEKEMPFGTTPLMIWDIVHAEKNADFFKVLSKLS